MAILACAFVSRAQTTTPNLGMTVPATGQINWQIPMDANLNILDTALGGIASLPAGTATPAITAAPNWLTANVSSTAISNFTGGFPGQTIRIICGGSDTFTTMVSGANLALSAGWSCVNSKTITLTLNGTVWTEIARQSIKFFPFATSTSAANCNNATPSAQWSLPTSAAPTVACRTGTNIQAGVLQFAQSNSAQFQVAIPAAFDSTGTVYARIRLTQGANTTSGQTIIMQLSTSCSAGTDDPAFNTAQSFATATTTTTANTTFDETLSGVTMTGCLAGHTLNVKVSRSATDTATTSPNVYFVVLTFPTQPVMEAY